MLKEEFLQLTISKQINHVNDIINKGGSLTSICKELGISKSISAKFKNHGYILKDKQYILELKEGQETSFKEPIEIKQKIDTITPGNTINVMELQQELKEVNPVGRPKTRDKNKIVKLTIEMNKDIIKALKFMAIGEEVYINQYIEELLKKNIPEKYFNI